jgi:hypothetical protein
MVLIRFGYDNTQSANLSINPSVNRHNLNASHAMMQSLFTVIRQEYLAQVTAPLLRTFIQLENDTNDGNTECRGVLPDVTQVLEYFTHAFDRATAAKNGAIDAREGVDEEYDQAIRSMRSVEEKVLLCIGGNDALSLSLSGTYDVHQFLSFVCWQISLLNI